VPIVIDTTAPVIDTLLPIDGEIVNERVINVTGHTEDDATVYVNGRFADLTDGFFSEQVNLDEGDNNVNILVTDVAGNTRAIHRLVVLDTFPPDIFIDGLVGEIMRTDASFVTITGNTEPTAILAVAYGQAGEDDPSAEIIPVDENGEFSYPVLLGKNKTTLVAFAAQDYAGNIGEVHFEIKRVVKDEPSYFERNPAAVWGILIVVIVLAVAFPVTKMMLDRTYDRRLKVMGYGTQVQPPPGQVPQHPPPGARPRGPPGAPPRMPPRPPSDQPRAPPRPPTQEEGGAPEAPRPPREDE
jgi:hypothetical protein